MSVSTINLEEQIKRLVAEHAKQYRNGKLLFAGWHDKNNQNGDVSLFEIYESFPDPGYGQLDTYAFPSSPEFPISGMIKLTITSPTELRDAISQKNPTLLHILNSTDKEAIYPDGADWNDFVKGFEQ